MEWGLGAKVTLRLVQSRFATIQLNKPNSSKYTRTHTHIHTHTHRLEVSPWRFRFIHKTGLFHEDIGINRQTVCLVINRVTQSRQYTSKRCLNGPISFAYLYLSS